MDTRTGDVMDRDELLRQLGQKDFGTYAKAVRQDMLPLVKQRELAETGRTKIGRNDPCPCGSSKKFKKCCLAVSE